MKKTRNHRLLKHGNYLITISQKNGKKTEKSTGRKRNQVGGFLNRYDIAYAGRDTVN